jgi:hypothetical protein
VSPAPVFPITGVRGNLIFGEGAHDDTWAVYRLSGATLPDDPVAALLELARAAGPELSLLCVPRRWLLERCAIGMEAAADIRHVRRAALEAYLDAQRRHLAGRDPHSSELYLSLRLPPGTTLLTAPAREEALRNRLSGCPGCEPADEAELRGLIHHALCRGLADASRLDPEFEVDGLILSEPTEAAPSEDAPSLQAHGLKVEVGTRGVRIATERGESHQAFLCAGAVPSAAGSASPLLAALDSLAFKVELALALQSGDEGSAVKLALSFCVAAATDDELERRVAQLRRTLPVARLHRPPGDQLRLFISHLPGKPSPLLACELSLSADELGSLVRPPPTRLGTDAGPYLGYTLDGLRKPVLFDLAAVAPAVVLAGAARSGKTVCAQLMMYQAFLGGSRVVDVDPSGEHALFALPEVTIDARVLELGSGAADRGALDPLLLAPGALGEQLGRALLLSLLPEPCPPEHHDAAVLAVRTAAAHGGDCADALALLAAGGPAAEAAAAIAGEAAEPTDAEPAGGGMSVPALAFGGVDRDQPSAVSEAVVGVRLDARVRRSPERAGRVLRQLLALYGLRLATHDPRRRTVLGVGGDWWSSPDDATGTAVARHIVRVAAAHRVTALFTTRSARDIDALSRLTAACLCFGAATEVEAGRAARLLGLSSESRAVVRQLTSLPRGACLLRDHAGRVAPVQVDVADPELLAALAYGNPGGRAGRVGQ